MNGAVWIYRIFDITEEIDLGLVERILSPAKPTSRLKLSRVRPKSIHIDNPPVTVELGERELLLKGTHYPAVATARIFDLGVVSIVLKIKLPDTLTYDQLQELSVYLYNTNDLSSVFQDYLDEIQRILKIPTLPDRNDFVEDFTIFFFRRWNAEWNPAPILLAETEPLSEQTIQETLKNSFSYGLGDLTIITWDAALVCDSEGSTDIPDLLEFATTQLLELRYYDRLLSIELKRSYDNIKMADQKGWWAKLQNYRKIMKKLMEIVIDITEITEKIQKQLKVTEDVFYARVYGGALSIFRTKEWTDSIQSKVRIIQGNYEMLSDELVNYRALLVELAIVGLFILDVFLTLVE